MIRLFNRDFWLWSLAVVAVILNAALGTYNIDSMVETQTLVSQTRLVQTEFISLLSDLKDAETGHRGFVITGDENYLKPFHQGIVDQQKHLDTLNGLTRDNPIQQERLNKLKDLIDEKFSEMNSTREIRRTQGMEVAAMEIRKGTGKELMDEIRDHVKLALTEETLKQEERQQDANHQIRVARIITLGAAALAIAIILIAAAVNQTELRRRLRANRVLSEAKTQLEASYAAVQNSEAQYRTLADHFEKQVEDRTADLQTQSLQLQQSNEELEKFAYIASHDLQEPLRKIQAFGDRLLKKQKDRLEPEGQESLNRMLDAAARMRRLIEDLLAFSRVSTNVKPFEPVSLNGVIAQVLSTFDMRLEQTGGKVEVELLPTVPGDESQLRQLFQNLIGNAIKFAKPGEPPCIHIDAIAFTDLAPEADPPRPKGNGWRVSIRDNGIGFEQHYSDRIFELFQRLHGRSTYEGTGLGLAICKKIATRHGISIQVRSTPGEGAIFILDWPERSEE